MKKVFFGALFVLSAMAMGSAGCTAKPSKSDARPAEAKDAPLYDSLKATGTPTCPPGKKPCGGKCISQDLKCYDE